ARAEQQQRASARHSETDMAQSGLFPPGIGEVEVFDLDEIACQMSRPRAMGKLFSTPVCAKASPINLPTSPARIAPPISFSTSRKTWMPMARFSQPSAG